MTLLTKEYIIDLYCFIDELLPKHKKARGRPSLLTNSELVTMHVWCMLSEECKTLKQIHKHICIYHKEDFPTMPAYSTFVEHSHRVIPQIQSVLSYILSTQAGTRIMDSTMLPVCKNHRVDSYKTAPNIAGWGKNHQGWHYGFKLHASIDLHGLLSGIAITPANVYDAQMMYEILNDRCDVAVGDTLYGAKVMGRKIFEEYGTVIIAPPHPKQKAKIAADWQNFLLGVRSKIESVFDVLKEHMHLISSFPRSPKGYLLHYLRVLVGYQITALCGGL